MTPDELCDLFSIDREGDSVMFKYLVYAMKGGEPVPHVIAEICRIMRMPRPAVYSRMKRALAPVFEADAATLEALGLRPQSTTVGLARELIRTMEGGNENGNAEPQ